MVELNEAVEHEADNVEKTVELDLESDGETIELNGADEVETESDGETRRVEENAKNVMMKLKQLKEEFGIIGVRRIENIQRVSQEHSEHLPEIEVGAEIIVDDETVQERIDEELNVQEQNDDTVQMQEERNDQEELSTDNVTVDEPVHMHEETNDQEELSTDNVIVDEPVRMQDELNDQIEDETLVVSRRKRRKIIEEYDSEEEEEIQIVNESNVQIPIEIEEEEEENVHVNVKPEPEQAQCSVPKTTRLKQIARKVTPNVVREITNRIAILKKELHESDFKIYLKRILIEKQKMNKRSVGQMKLETLEKLVIDFLTKQRLVELKKDKSEADEEVRRERELYEEEKRIRKEREELNKKLNEELRKEKELTKKVQREQRDIYVDLEDLVAKQFTEDPFGRNQDTSPDDTNVDDLTDFDETGRRCVKEIEDFCNKQSLSESEDEGKKKKEESSSRIVNPSVAELREERERLEKRKRGILANIKGWRYDINENAVVVKRMDDSCSYFRSTKELTRLSKDDLFQLSKIRMVNHGAYPHGREVEDLVRQHAKSNFVNFQSKMKHKRKRSTMWLDNTPIRTAKKIKINDAADVTGWRMDWEFHEIVIERADGSEDRLYEDADIRALRNQDLLALEKLPFRNHEVNEEGTHTIKVVEFLV
jgi:hypothetical protein